MSKQKEYRIQDAKDYYAPFIECRVNQKAIADTFSGQLKRLRDSTRMVAPDGMSMHGSRVFCSLPNLDKHFIENNEDAEAVEVYKKGLDSTYHFITSSVWSLGKVQYEFDAGMLEALYGSDPDWWRSYAIEQLKNDFRPWSVYISLIALDSDVSGAFVGFALDESGTGLALEIAMMDRCPLYRKKRHYFIPLDQSDDLGELHDGVWEEEIRQDMERIFPALVAGCSNLFRQVVFKATPTGAVPVDKVPERDSEDMSLEAIRSRVLDPYDYFVFPGFREEKDMN